MAAIASAAATGTDLKRVTTLALTLVLAAGMAGAAVPQNIGLPASYPTLGGVTPPDVSPEIPVVLLVDLASGQTLYERDSHRRFVPASVTKVMTAYSAFKLIDEGKLSPDQQITVPAEIADNWYAEGSSMFLKAGDKVTVDQLLTGITTVSANDGSVVMATLAAGSVEGWLKVMNGNAAELGMRDTHYGTPNGWPDEGRTFTTAHDLAILAEALTTRYPELYRRYFGRRGMSYGGFTQSNHDPVTGVVDGADGIKTGYTRQSGYNFVGSAERNGRRLVVVVGGVPRIPLRNQVSRDLLRWGFDAFETRVVLPSDMQVGQALVQNGASGLVPLRTRTPVLTAFPRGEKAEPSLSIRYRGPIEAPIAAGATVGMLRVSIPGQQPHDVPLVAGSAVERASSWQRLVNGMSGLFT